MATGRIGVLRHMSHDLEYWSEDSNSSGYDIRYIFPYGLETRKKRVVLPESPCLVNKNYLRLRIDSADDLFLFASFIFIFVS